MKKSNYAANLRKSVNPFVTSGLVLSLAATLCGQEQKVEILKTFTTSDPTISKDVAVRGGAWFVDSKKGQTIRLFEIADPQTEDCMVVYRAQLKSEGLKESAYLEMWCRVAGRGEFFSRGLENPLTGSNDWASYEIPFFLKKGEKPDLIKLNIVLKGSGKVWIKDVKLLKGPLPPQQ
jgi:hypothetical protein